MSDNDSAAGTAEPKGLPNSDRFSSETVHHEPDKRPEGHDSDEDIRTEAYHVWVEQGRPDGDHDAHWEQARHRLQQRRSRSGR